MTKQETFDTVVAHLRKQGAKATDGIGCKYRTSDGLQCAAGCLIPDERYSPGLENSIVSDTSGAGMLIMELGHDLQIVRALQCVHDYEPIRDWEAHFDGVARRHELVYSPVNGGQA